MLRPCPSDPECCDRDAVILNAVPVHDSSSRVPFSPSARGSRSSEPDGRARRSLCRRCRYGRILIFEITLVPGFPSQVARFNLLTLFFHFLISLLSLFSSLLFYVIPRGFHPHSLLFSSFFLSLSLSSQSDAPVCSPTLLAVPAPNTCAVGLNLATAAAGIAWSRMLSP